MRLRVSICLVLAGITLAAFAGVAYGSFIVFDDGNYVVNHPAIQHGFSLKSIKWAFSSFDSSNWHPLVWLSLMLDYQLFGLNPGGYHLVNLAFHMANTVLLFLLLEKMTDRVWPSAFVALLFGIHPMHVESVAWVSERKDVLSAFFFLLTLMAYARYAQSTVRSPQSPVHRWLLYLLTLFLFALGLMSKPMVVSLPFILLLLDFWPLQRLSAHTSPGGAAAPPYRFQRLIIEKIPFFILSAFSCYFTYLAQKGGGAVRQTIEYSIMDRLNHVPVSYGWYILKLFWPVRLSIYYELHPAPFGMEVVLAWLLLVVLTLFAIRSFRKCPYFFCGWFWFLGMMIPVIGLVQVGSQAYADRYAYLPYIGLFIMIAWGIPHLLEWRSSTFHSLSSALVWACAALVAIACFIRTVQEVGYWKDGVTLFERAVALDPKDETALTLLGAEYSNRRNDAKASDCMNRALALSPRFYLAWQYLGFLYTREGDYDRGAQAYQNALKYTRSDSIRMDIYNGLGHAFQMATNCDGAISAFQSSVAISPEQPKIQAELGQCLLERQQPEQAADAFQAAIDLEPANAQAQLGLGMCLASTGRDAEAMGHFRAAVQADTNSVMALNNLAWTLAADADPGLRDGREAVPLAERACRLTHYQNAQSIGTLAAAYAEAGRFDDAVTVARKAHDVALAHGDKGIADRNEELLKLYLAHKPFHMGEGN